jgi:drug/metabolite transporter (DMT)-like permease
MKRALQADFFLLVVALIWGVTFPLVTQALHSINAFLFVTLRFTCAALVLLPWIFKSLIKTSPAVLKAGMILGMLNAGIFLFQTFGMQFVDTDTTAFVAASGVIFVPFVAYLMKLARVRPVEYMGTFICFCGLYILTGGSLSHLKPGASWIFLANLFWAIGICYLQKVTPRIQELNLLAFYQIVFTLPFAASLTIMDPQIYKFTPLVIIAVTYTGVLATALVYLIQVRYQKETTATHAAMIYSLEPVLASIFAIYINHEPLDKRVLLGGGIVLFSILLVEMLPNLKKIKKKSLHEQ